MADPGAESRAGSRAFAASGEPGASSYDEVAAPFDRLAVRFSTGHAEHLVSLARIQPGQRVLDVGCGTGVAALAAARATGAAGRVLGIDVSAPMLARARERAAQLGLGSVAAFERMDAQHLELPDASQDAAVSLFAFLHIPDPQRALAEIHRVLVPGGRLVIAVGSRAPLLSPAGLRAAARSLAGLMRRLRRTEIVAHQPLERLIERELPRRAAADPAAEGRHRRRPLARLVRDAGLRVLATDWRGREDVLDDVAEFWQLQRTLCSTARERLVGAPGEAVERIRREFEALCAPVLARGGRLVYRHAASFLVAERSGGRG